MPQGLKQDTQVRSDGKTIIHVREDSEKEMDRMFSVALANKPHPSGAPPPFKNRNLPKSFFSKPPPNEAKQHQNRIPGSDAMNFQAVNFGQLSGQHARGNSSPAAMNVLINRQNFGVHSRQWSYNDVLDNFPLPPGWEKGVTADNQVYYINHNDETTTWEDPRERMPQYQQYLARSLSGQQGASEMFDRPMPSISEQGVQNSQSVPAGIPPLPNNWEMGVNEDGEIYYIDHSSKTTTWFHPLVEPNLQRPGMKASLIQQYGFQRAVAMHDQMSGNQVGFGGRAASLPVESSADSSMMDSNFLAVNNMQQSPPSFSGIRGNQNIPTEQMASIEQNQIQHQMASIRLKNEMTNQQYRQQPPVSFHHRGGSAGTSSASDTSSVSLSGGGNNNLLCSMPSFGNSPIGDININSSSSPSLIEDVGDASSGGSFIDATGNAARRVSRQLYHRPVSADNSNTNGVKISQQRSSSLHHMQQQSLPIHHQQQSSSNEQQQLTLDQQQMLFHQHHPRSESAGGILEQGEAGTRGEIPMVGGSGVNQQQERQSHEMMDTFNRRGFSNKMENESLIRDNFSMDEDHEMQPISLSGPPSIHHQQTGSSDSTRSETMSNSMGISNNSNQQQMGSFSVSTALNFQRSANQHPQVIHHQQRSNPLPQLGPPVHQHTSSAHGLLEDVSQNSFIPTDQNISSQLFMQKRQNVDPENMNTGYPSTIMMGGNISGIPSSIPASTVVPAASNLGNNGTLRGALTIGACESMMTDHRDMTGAGVSGPNSNFPPHNQQQSPFPDSFSRMNNQGGNNAGENSSSVSSSNITSNNSNSNILNNNNSIVMNNNNVNNEMSIGNGGDTLTMTSARNLTAVVQQSRHENGNATNTGIVNDGHLSSSAMMLVGGQNTNNNSNNQQQQGMVDSNFNINQNQQQQQIPPTLSHIIGDGINGGGSTRWL